MGPLAAVWLVLTLITITPAGASPSIADPAPATGWAWPLQPAPAVLARFDPPERRWLAGHRGVDLAAAVDQVVRAPTGGRVTYVGVIAGRHVLTVTHASGLRSSFEPVEATLVVGAAVARGDTVGRVTSEPGHCAPATCLHWGVRRAETYVDPLALVFWEPPVLLPVWTR